MKRFVFILGVILLISGVVGLVHPNFSYHKQEELAKLGPYKATLDEEKTLQVPALGGQFKSGQLGSDQNRPTEVARNC
jgi:hypothetical protein